MSRSSQPGNTENRRCAPGGAGAAIQAAMRKGLVVGRHVRLGVVNGIVIGYNIARGGRYPGARFPLLVTTDLGVAKCRVDEVAGALA